MQKWVVSLTWHTANRDQASIAKSRGGENRHVYRWNFNPIFVPYSKVSGFRNKVSGVRFQRLCSSFLV